MAVAMDPDMVAAMAAGTKHLLFITGVVFAVNLFAPSLHAALETQPYDPTVRRASQKLLQKTTRWKRNALVRQLEGKAPQAPPTHTFHDIVHAAKTAKDDAQKYGRRVSEHRTKFEVPAEKMDVLADREVKITNGKQLWKLAKEKPEDLKRIKTLVCHNFKLGKHIETLQAILKAASQISTLSLGNTHITASLFEGLVPHLPSLETLDLSQNLYLRVEKLFSIDATLNITTLTLIGAPFTLGKENAARYTREEPIPEDFSMKLKLPNLKTLSIGRTDMGNLGAKWFIAKRNQFPLRTTLSLQGILPKLTPKTLEMIVFESQHGFKPMAEKRAEALRKTFP